MANELQFRGPGTARTCYCLIRNRIGQIWSTSGGTGGFDNFIAGSYTDYDIAATEQGSTNYYQASMPAAVPAGVYNISALEQIGGAVAQTDPIIATGEEQWNGSALFPLSDLATSGQVGQNLPIRLSRGIAVSGFPFKLVSSLDHVTPFVSGIVSGQISRDGGAFTNLQSGLVAAAYTEIGLGFYRCNFTSGDLLATTIALSFSAAGISGGVSDSRDMTIIMQRVSGQ